MSKILIDEATVKLALEALKVSVPVILGNFSRHSKAIAALEALAEPDFWEGYVPEPDKRQQALDKMAENARELGLDYEPAQQEPVAIVAVDGVGQIQVGWITKPQHNDKLYTSPPAQQEPVATCPQDIIHAITLYGDARADQDANNAPTTSHERLADCIRLVRKALPAPVQQEPVAFLANGTRFKISYDSRQSGGQIHGIPAELGGQWVAFVAADDDCHLKLTSPPAQRKPLTDEEALELWSKHEKHWRFENNALAFARAIEAAHGIKE